MTEENTQETKQFNLNEWKRVYSNEDPEIAKQWFLDNFNSDDYSLYLASYNDSLPPLGFMKKNLVRGFYQGFDGKMHKIAFASCLIGETIEFVWLFQGKTIPPEMQESTLYESSNWKECGVETAFDFFFPNDEDAEILVFK